MKTCTRCKEPKEATRKYFYADKRNRDGLQSHCKECMKAVHRTPEHQQYRRTHRRPERIVWENIIQRCTNPKNPKYRYYGGRGITVCDKWRDSFDAFFLDVGARPSSELSLERKDNNGNYEPGNCVWDTWSAQQRNRRRARPTPKNSEPL